MKRACVLVGVLSACSGSDPVDSRPDAAIDDSGIMDAATQDAVVLDARPMDAALADVGVMDAGGRDAAGLDAAPVDAGVDPRLGIITGACGELDDTELLSAEPFAFSNRIDFPQGFAFADQTRLSTGTQAILQAGTAGGSSEWSEAFSFEVLFRCEDARLIKTETEIVYDDPDSKKTDILVEIDGRRIGVSVTRAVGFPRDDPYPVTRARALLEDKLADILDSSMNVSAPDAWVKQILHVIAYGPMHGESILTAAMTVAPAIRSDTIIWVTVSDGDDAFLYD